MLQFSYINLKHETNHEIQIIRSKKSKFEKIIHLTEDDNRVRLSRARIEKRDKPPLRPAPIEKPLTDEAIILRSLAESLNGKRSNQTEEQE